MKLQNQKQKASKTIVKNDVLGSLKTGLVLSPSLHSVILQIWAQDLKSLLGNVQSSQSQGLKWDFCPHQSWYWHRSPPENLKCVNTCSYHAFASSQMFVVKISKSQMGPPASAPTSNWAAVNVERRQDLCLISDHSLQVHQLTVQLIGTIRHILPQWWFGVKFLPLKIQK